MRHVVTSSDGALFAVESTPRSVPFEQAFARTRTAAELTTHGDFRPVESLDDVEGPLAPTADERRAAFYVIRGGRP